MRAHRLLLAVLCFAHPGCDFDDIIGLTPENAIPAEKFYRNQGEVVAALNATYAMLQNWYGTGSTGLLCNNAQTGCTAGMWMFGEMRSDNTHFNRPVGRAGEQTENVEYITFGTAPSVSPPSLAAYGAYSVMYSIIRDANTILNRAPKAEWVGAQGDSVKNRVMGEALFIRGLLYFDLIRIYGGVPLITDLVEDAADLEETVLSTPRASMDETFARIVADADSAYRLLWTKQQTAGTVAGTSGNLGRATKGAAAMLAAKAYLEWAARTPVGAQRTARYNQVIQWLDRLDASNPEAPYAVVSNFAQIFNPANKNVSPELIFEIQWSGPLTNQNSPYATDWTGPGANVFMRNLLRDPITNAQVFPCTQTGGSNFNIATPDLALNGWEPGDRRKAHTLFLWHYPRATTGTNAYPALNRQVAYFDPSTPTGGTQTALSTTCGASTYVASDSVIPIGRKFAYTLVAQNQSSNNFPIFRYSDAVLSRAEAMAELGDLAGATSQLNRVRTAHSGLTGVTTPASRADFMVALLKERRAEFAFENHRWFDLVRIKQTPAGESYAIPIMRAHGDSQRFWNEAHRAEVPGKYAGAYLVTQRDLLMPFPLQEIQRNSALSPADQNPGY